MNTSGGNAEAVEFKGESVTLAESSGRNKSSLATIPSRSMKRSDSGSEEVFERSWALGVKAEDRRVSPMKGVPDGLAHILNEDFLRAVCGELLGTFLFLFGVITIARFVTVNGGSDEFSASTIYIALGFGMYIFVLVYIFAGISGANLNPAVSIALVIGKRISVEKFIFYVLAQCAGAIGGAALATTFMDTPGGGYNAVADGVKVEDAFAGEVMCTYILILTVLGATDGELNRKQAHTWSLLPLAIGMAVFIAHLTLIPVDGCSINPARSLGTAVTNNRWEDHWVFWVGPLLGGALGIITWEALLRPKQYVGLTRDLPEGTKVARGGVINEAKKQYQTFA